MVALLGEAELSRVGSGCFLGKLCTWQRPWSIHKAHGRKVELSESSGHPEDESG